MKYEIFECLRQINQIDYEVPVLRSSRKLDFGIVETEEEEEDINDRVQEECQRQRTYHSLLSQLREMFVKYQQLCWRQCQLPFAVFEWHWRAWQLQRMIEKVSWYTLTIQNVTVGSPPTSTSCNLSQLLLIVHGGIIWYNSVLWCQSLLFSSQNFSCLIL